MDPKGADWSMPPGECLPELPSYRGPITEHEHPIPSLRARRIREAMAWVPVRAGLGALVVAGLCAVDALADDAEVLRRAVDYTIAAQQPDGSFRYDFDFLAGEPTGSDNIVRQAGTLFALGEALLETDDRRLVPVMRAGLDRLASLSLPIGAGTTQSALASLGLFSVDSRRLARALDRWGLLYRPQGSGQLVSGDGSYRGAPAGATSLALIAELSYARATGDDRYRDQREAWVRGLLALHVPGEGIRRSPVTLKQGPYEDGEGWLALAVYHEHDPANEEVARALGELEEHSIATYGGAPDRNFYHWGAIASAARFAETADPRLADFAAAQAGWILGERPPSATEHFGSCSFVEGLSSAYAVVAAAGGRDGLADRLRERVALELERNRALQIQPGTERLELGGGAVLDAPTLAGQAGAFRAGTYRAFTRIDLTQHCISAFLKARRSGLGNG